MGIQHTPGPWIIRVGTNLLTRYIDFTGTPDHTACTVAEIWPEDDCGESIEMAEANARLIAAAPDLLEALRLLLDYPSGQYSSRGDYDAAYEKASVAIAKATGAV